MKSFLPGPLLENARNFMRQAGYGELRTHHGQISYARRLGGGNFPRLHAYVEDDRGGIQINLHLDQKEHSIGSGAAHAGEYEGPLVEQEMTRLLALGSPLRSTEKTSPSPSQTPRPYKGFDGEEKKTGFFGKLFG